MTNKAIFKRCIVFLLLFAIVLQLLMFNTFAATTLDNELSSLRKQIKTVDDITDTVYSRLEKIMLSKFTDVKKDEWYMSVMTKLAGLGSLDGTVHGTMEPLGTVTNAMFIKMFIRAMLGEDGINDVEADFEHWAARDIKKAEEMGLIGTNLYSLANVAEPITRKEMALIIIRAYMKFEKDPLTYEDCKHLAEEIKDFDEIPSLYQPYVLIAYGSGIISGYTDGRFGPDDTATRAQAAAFIIRYLDPRERADKGIRKTETNEPRILRYDDPYRPMAREGDIFIKPDGTEVVLKVGPAGVLGELQGVATEIGRAHPNGELIKHGDLGSNIEFLGQPYLVDEKTGEGHYRSEWLAIREYYTRRAFEKYGHDVEDGTMYGSWVMYYYGQWCWVGP